MKKASAIFLSLLFLFSTGGVVINTHFCKMLNKSEKSLFTKKYCCDGMEEEDGCCHNETKVIKVTDNFSPSQSVKLTLPFFQFITPEHINNVLNIFNFNNTKIFYLNIRPPLLYQGVSLFVLYRSILI